MSCEQEKKKQNKIENNSHFQTHMHTYTFTSRDRETQTIKIEGIICILYIPNMYVCEHLCILILYTYEVSLSRVTYKWACKHEDGRRNSKSTQNNHNKKKQYTISKHNKRYSKNYINKSWQHTHNGLFFFACVCKKSGEKKTLQIKNKTWKTERKKRNLF